MDRRKFIKAGGILLVGSTGIKGLHLMAAAPENAGETTGGASHRRWGLVIDLTKCAADCDACMTACRNENNVAFYNDERWDIHWIRKVFVKSKTVPNNAEKPVILMCNHCDEPPCAQVCPVQATYKRDDGIVIVDHHRCMGCRYCMVACPYNARYFNYKENPDWPNKKLPKRSHGVAESCNFCAHLLDEGKQPACVEACRKTGRGAMTFGDLNDPNSEISRMVATQNVTRIREDFGCEPKVYYLGL